MRALEKIGRGQDPIAADQAIDLQEERQERDEVHHAQEAEEEEGRHPVTAPAPAQAEQGRLAGCTFRAAVQMGGALGSGRLAKCSQLSVASTSLRRCEHHCVNGFTM